MPAPKKTTQKSEPKPELVYELEGAPPLLFVIRDRPTGRWWGPNEAGYVDSVLKAGTYPETRARQIERQREENEAVLLAVAVRDAVTGANPTVLQALFAMGSR